MAFDRCFENAFNYSPKWIIFPPFYNGYKCREGKLLVHWLAVYIEIEDGGAKSLFLINLASNENKTTYISAVMYGLRQMLLKCI